MKSRIPLYLCHAMSWADVEEAKSKEDFKFWFQPLMGGLTFNIPIGKRRY